MRIVGRETALGRGENVERAMLQHRPMASENKIVIPDLEMNVQFDSHGEDAVSLSSSLSSLSSAFSTSEEKVSGCPEQRPSLLLSLRRMTRYLRRSKDG